MSFLSFVGLLAEDETPDHTMIWRFRQKLAEDSLVAGLFGELERQLERNGVVIRHGTLIDALIPQSAARRPRLDEGQTSRSDPDARFGANHERRRFTFGDKRCFCFHCMPFFNARRNRTAFGLAGIAFNLRRWHALATP